MTDLHATARSDPDPEILADVDCAVIGGGVVGCAIARQLTLDGASVALVEKAPDILAGASKGNSAILHTGFDAPPGSLEASCVIDGQQEYRAIRQALNLPLRETGALVAAWSPEEEDRLAGIQDKARQNGVTDTRLLTSGEVLAREPNLSPAIRAALLVPGEVIIDPWTAPLAYLTQAVANGAQALFNAEVTGGRFDGAAWELQATRGMIRARHVINCAGLFGDRLESAVFGHSDFEIRPRKGQFAVFDKAASELLGSILLPVPTARTKGVVIFPTIFGNLAVGPTAEEQDSREDAEVDRDALQELLDFAHDLLPALAGMPVTATYAGIRPATEQPEYRFRHRPDENWISVGGIRSTGLSAALGLARHVSACLDLGAQGAKPLQAPAVPQMPNLAEHRPRDWQKPGYGEIVCHCEWVTDREIEAALSGDLPAGSLEGLKRRTRATMGRCQGFHCSARLAELTEGRFEQNLSVGKAHD